MKIFKYPVRTSKRCEFINIDNLLKKALRESGVSSGLAFIFCPHTTAAVTINENADPDVVSDMSEFLNKLIPLRSGFKHAEGNSDSHIKSSLTGAGETVIIDNNKPLLGTWQSVYFAEYDGPRQRNVYIKILADTLKPAE